MSVLDNSTLWVGVSFIIFIALIIRPASKGLTELLEKRIKNVSKKIEDSEKLMIEATKILEEYKMKQKNVKKDIEIMFKKADKDSEIIEKNFLSKIKDITIKKDKLFNQRVKQLNDRFEKEISDEIIKNVIQVTEKRIKKALDPKKNNFLIKTSIENMQSKIDL